MNPRREGRGATERSGRSWGRDYLIRLILLAYVGIAKRRLRLRIAAELQTSRLIADGPQSGMMRNVRASDGLLSDCCRFCPKLNSA
jgi:hypothetical protein